MLVHWRVYQSDDWLIIHHCIATPWFFIPYNPNRFKSWKNPSRPSHLCFGRAREPFRSLQPAAMFGRHWFSGRLSGAKGLTQTAQVPTREQPYLTVGSAHVRSTDLQTLFLSPIEGNLNGTKWTHLGNIEDKTDNPVSVFYSFNPSKTWWISLIIWKINVETTHWSDDTLQLINKNKHRVMPFWPIQTLPSYIYI